MRKVLISLGIVALMLTFSSTTYQIDVSNQSMDSILNQTLETVITLSSAGDSGVSLPVTQLMSRSLNTLQVEILNSYSDTGTHSGEIDLTGYLAPGWHIYKVEMDVSQLEAAPEREVLGVTYENPFFWILESGPTNYSQLAQGFYNQPFNGSLQNYSIYFSTDDYTPPTRGNASFYIMSNYTTSSAITTPINMTEHDAAFSWDVLPGESAGLDANSVYWAVINGSLLKKGGAPTPSLPLIYWGSEDAGGSFDSYIMGNGVWQPATLEPLFNYTYIPWNRTSNAALQFFSPDSLSLQANSSPMTGSSWTFTNDISNITSINLNTNQSVYLDYDITIWYKKAGTASTNWYSDTPSPNIEWNATAAITYPSFSGTLNRFLNYTVQSDWIPTDLYNGSTPIVGTNTKYDTIVHCTTMTDGTWILSSSAPNYVTAVDLSDSSDSSPIGSKVNNSVDMDIDATIEDGDINPITGGTTNLTVLQSGSQVYAPAETTATAGLSTFLWDISATTTGNGTHSVEVYWTNGTEAGYSVVDVFVYYATMLVADDMSIAAFTEDTFNIGIDFDQIFPVRGLDGSLAAVTYDFGSGNTSLIPDGGGRWSAPVSTASMTDGVYSLYIYAEGYALENRSLTINVDLVHETKPLNWSWSNTDNITYTASTNLSITYRMLDETRIAGATVNVTFESQTFDMAWDPLTETYWIELTGVNFSGDGTFPLYVSAWRAGYLSRYNDTNTITITSETGISFIVDYQPVSLNISYIENMTILVTYNFNSNPIQDNTSVRILFNGSAPVDLVFNPTSSKWETTLLGVNYLGGWDITVRATADGYATRTNSTVFIVHEDTPIVSSSWTGFSETTDYVTIAQLVITVTDSSVIPINNANVSFIAFGTLYQDTTGVGGDYTFNIDPADIRGIESFTVSVVAIGFLSDQVAHNLTVEATTSLTFRNFVSSEYEEWNLTIEARYLDTLYSYPITNATVTVTLDGTDYILQYSNTTEVYTIEIVLDMDPGDYTIFVSAVAEFAVSANNQAAFAVRAKEVVTLEVTFDGDLIAGQFMEIQATLRDNDSNPVQGETIRFEVSVYFDNGTIAVYNAETMTDQTNAEGVASVGFEVPFGNVDRLIARATFDGSQSLWHTEILEEASVSVSPLSLLIAFFLSDIGFLMIISIALVGIVAAGYNRAIKPKKKAAKKGLENQLQMFRDLETVQHFMAVYLDRGTCVFYHPFTDERIQPDLISGFIAAITSVYGEIKGDGVRGTLEEIQYQGLRLNSYSGQYLIGILILGGEMTPLLRERLQFFVELFENQYDHDLDGWTGVVDCFDPEWVVSTLNSAFNYAWHLPHRFGPTQKVSKDDAKILDYIGAVRDDRSEFYIKDLVAPLSEMLDRSPAQVLDRLLLLEDKGIILPIGIQTILQRQGLALVDGAEEFPASAEREPEEELEYEDMEAEPVEEPEEKADVDPMEAFVQDVETLLEKEAKDEDKPDADK